MKKITAVAIIALFCVIYAGGAEASEWEKVNTIHTGGYAEDRYSITNDDGTSCRVLILKNVDRLAIGATDPNWYGKTANHIAEIGSRGEFVYNVINLRTPKSILGIPYESEKRDAGYWVFSSKCIKAAKLLPEEVRKRFNGAFGIR